MNVVNRPQDCLGMLASQFLAPGFQSSAFLSLPAKWENWIGSRCKHLGSEPAERGSINLCFSLYLQLFQKIKWGPALWHSG